VREQVLMTAATQNIKRMVKLLSERAPMREAGVDRAPLLCLWKSLKSLVSLTRRLHECLGPPEGAVGWN